MTGTCCPTSWSEGHPLGEAANQLIASMIRKMGGFSFRELNLTMDDIKTMSQDAPTSPTTSSRGPPTTTRSSRATPSSCASRCGWRSSSASTRRRSSTRSRTTTSSPTSSSTSRRRPGTTSTSSAARRSRGGALAERVRADLVERLTGPDTPYNRTFTTNGIACTAASVITATLGIRNLAEIGPAEAARITKIHLLLAMFTALQPGVFALSGWDLTGMLTLDTGAMADLIA